MWLSICVTLERTAEWPDFAGVLLWKSKHLVERMFKIVLTQIEL